MIKSKWRYYYFLITSQLGNQRFNCSSFFVGENGSWLKLLGIDLSVIAVIDSKN